MTENARLCSRCQALSILSLLYRPGPLAQGIPGQSWEHELGTLPEIYNNICCDFCVLVKRALQAWYGEQHLESKIREDVPVKVFLFGSPFDIDTEEATSQHNSVPCYLQIGFRTTLYGMEHREDRFRNDEFNRAAHLTSLFSVGSASSTEGIIHPGRVVNPDSIDWAYVRSWIASCSDQAHTNAHHEPSDSVTQDPVNYPTMRVIDIHTACITHLPDPASYVALSYQWGMDQKLKLKMDNAKRLQTPGYFNVTDCQPSRTIVDAVEVTKLLGYRYLWVDALCIIQDNAQDLKQNVNIMDEIYNNAVLTIVGAAGANAEHGLPGVSLSRTEQQARIIIDGTIVANMLEPADGAITFSRWNTRGWTYQERMLSRKLLMFTSSQVFYQCHRGCNFQEQFRLRSECNHLAPFDPRAVLDLESRSTWETYALAVAEYTKRSLGDPNDKLRAFEGLTNFLASPLQTHFFFGLPVSLFDVALLWAFVEPVDRGLPTFPSWCWAGWNGPVRYAYANSMNNMCECTISQATITTQSGKVELCRDVTSADDAPSRCYDRQHWRRQLDADTLEIFYSTDLGPFTSICYPRPAPPPETAWDVYKEKSALLKIAGKTAMFELTEQHSQQSQSIPQNKGKCKQGQHELCHLAILDAHERWAGTIVIDGRLLPAIKHRHYKFVALSRSTLYRVDIDPSWDEETSTFRHWSTQSKEQKEAEDDDEEPNEDFFDRQHFSAQVWWPAMNILLLSEPDEDGVVERMGVGRVHVDAFDAIAVPETIFLG
jgi:hypothetical protein